MKMAIEVNPSLRGFRCIRCGARYRIGDYFEGCPACAKAGYPASLAAEYLPEAPVAGAGRLPLRCASYLGEGDTPLVSLDRLRSELKLGGLWAKLESANPSGSHKDRMSRFVVARAQQLGFSHVIAASSGNAGVSLAATAALAGVGATIIVRRGAPGRWVEAIRGHGAELIESPDSMARWVETRERVAAGAHYPATNYCMPPVGSNPFGVQGYKTVAYELVDALGSRGADAILVPTDRGDLLWGIYEGLRELHEQGQLASLPRLFAIEPYARTCAVLDGADYRQSFEGHSAQASVAGSTVSWQSVVALRATRGGGVVVDDEAALASQSVLAEHGVSAELCSAATLYAVGSLLEQGALDEGSRVVLMITADGSLAVEPDDEIQTR